MGRISLRLFCCGMLAAALLARACSAEEIPQPLDLGTKDVSAFVAVPDVDTLVKNIESVAAEFAPGQVKRGQIKMQLGMMLGDPALANLDATKPIVLFLMKAPAPEGPPGEPPIAIFIPAKAAAPFEQTFKQLKFASSFQDGVLIVAKTDDNLAKAKALTGAWQKISAAGIKGDARIFASMTNLLETYGSTLKNGMDMVQKQVAMNPPPANGPVKMDPATIQKILGMELKAVTGVLNQSDSIQYDLHLKADAFTVEALYSAKPGSTLAAALVAPPPGKNQTMGALSSGKSALAVTMRVNSAAYGVFLNAVIAELMKDPQFADFKADDLIDVVKQTSDFFGGDMSFALTPEKDNPFATQVSMSITDEKKYMAIVEKMAQSPVLASMYEKMGMKMKMTLEKDVREHGGVKIQRMKVEMDMANLPPDQAAQMKQMVKDQEFTFVKNMYLGANSAAGLDKMIDRVLSGEAAKNELALQSVQNFGEGKAIYMDYDMIALMKGILAANPMFAGIFAQLKGGEPITAAGNFADGRVFGQIKIPLAPFIEIGNVVRGMMPQPPPPPKEEKF